MGEVVTKQDIDAVHSRIDEIEKFLENVLHRVEQALGLQKNQTPAPAKAPTLQIIEGAPSCPEHPDAPQTANGCTAKACTFSPAAT